MNSLAAQGLGMDGCHEGFSGLLWSSKKPPGVVSGIVVPNGLSKLKDLVLEDYHINDELILKFCYILAIVIPTTPASELVTPKLCLTYFYKNTKKLQLK